MGRRLLGFGDGADLAYMVHTDEFDLKWVERYHIALGGGSQSNGG